MARIIGIAGTAKNTGKTTTMTALMEEVYRKKIILGLTSIGYDGEMMDNVTGLPKPRVTAQAGTLVAIAAGCLPGCSAEIEIIEETDIKTALGRVIIGRVQKEGLVVLAGPNKSTELRRVNHLLAQYGCGLIFVDGALNRVAPMAETDGLILATGAARTTDIDKLALETKAIARLLNLPDYHATQVKEYSILQVSSLLNGEMVEEMLEQLTPQIREIHIAGLIGENSFVALLETGREKLAGHTLVLSDPIKILVAGAPDKMLTILESLTDAGITVMVKKGLHLLAITINPFYPRYRYVTHDYEPAYVDKNRLKEMLGHECPVAVVDVVDVGVEKLWHYLQQ